jgi:predicted nuclease of predicted toxin-antitoxin system
VKLLFDQNLSFRLVGLLEDVFPGSQHVREVGLKEADDSAVWDYAKQHGFVIASKDSDFHQRSFVLGYPPKVVWIRLGNCSTRDIERLLRQYVNAIEAFNADAEAAFLSLTWQ